MMTRGFFILRLAVSAFCVVGINLTIFVVSEGVVGYVVSIATIAGLAFTIWGDAQADKAARAAIAAPEIPSPSRSSTPAPRGFIIDLCMPPERAGDVVYNLLGRFDYWVEKHGARRARLIFTIQSLGAIFTFWSDWVVKRARRLRSTRSS